jgi:serine/threonine protein kinase
MLGRTLAHYKILEKIGEGGMGEVYLAEDTKLKRQVALKILPPEMASDEARLERFQREAETVAGTITRSDLRDRCASGRCPERRSREGHYAS